MPPDTTSIEDLRRYLLHRVDLGISPVFLNAAISGVKSFFNVTLDHAELIVRMQPVQVPRRHRTRLNESATTAPSEEDVPERRVTG